jgi:PAS domain S-box-containing protein
MQGYIAQRTSGSRLRLHSVRYLVAALCSVVGVFLGFSLRAVLDPAVPLLIGVLVSAWVSGLGPALASSVLATLALDYFFTPPLRTLSLEFAHIPRLAAFTAVAALAASTSAARRNAERSLKQGRDELETRVRTRTSDLTRANARLATQYSVTRVLSDSKGLDQAAPQLLEIIATAIGCQWGALWKSDRETGLLRCDTVWHDAGLPAAELEAMREMTFAPGRGLPGRVWHTATPQWIADVAQDESFLRAADAARGALRGGLAFPILLKENQPVGVMEFFSRGVRQPDREELDTLSAIGSQIGQFIERQRAEDERQQLGAREQTALAEALGAQHRFRDLVNSIEGIVWEADPRTLQFTFASTQAERILGYPVARWLNEPTFWKDHILPDDRQRSLDLRLAAAAEGRNQDVEYRMIAIDGRAVWVRDLMSVAIAGDGTTTTLRGVMFDISARKQDEKAVREQADLLDLTHDTVFVRDLQDVITYWNRGAEELYGWSKAEAMGRVSHDLTQTVFPEPLETLLTQLLQSGRWEGELLHKRREGTPLVVASRWSLQRGADGEPIAILETNNDVTARRQAEEELRDSKEQWEAVFENNPTMYFVVDPESTVVSVNPFGAEQLGYTVLELVGAPVQKVFLEEDHAAVSETITRCVQQLGRVLTWEMRKVRKDGSVIWVRETAKAMRRAKGKPIVLIACEDVTARKRAEAELQESERRHRHIFHATGVSIWEEDFSQVKAAVDALKANGVHDFGEYLRTSPSWVEEMIPLVRVADVNEATLELFGARTKEELIGSLNKVFTPDTRKVFAGELIAIAEGQPSFEGETILQTLSGDRIAVLFSVSFPPPESTFDAVLVSIMDITARKRAEQELEELAGRLIHAQEQERSRIGRELHDHISQLLGVLTIEIDQLRADAAIPSHVGAALDRLRKNTVEITQDVHRLSHRLHSSTLDYLGLGPALQKMVSEFSERHGIAIEFTHPSLPPVLPSEVALCLFRVTEESLNNIAKHSHAVSARIDVNAGSDGIHLRIEDGGDGFDVAAVESRAGLGFVSMRERLRVLRGTLHIDSGRSRGTKIAVWVPPASLRADEPAGTAGEGSFSEAPPHVSSP